MSSWSSACFGITVLMLVWMNLLLWISCLIYSWVHTHTHTELPWQSGSADGALGLTTESPPTLMITVWQLTYQQHIQDNFKCFEWCFSGYSTEMWHFQSLGQYYVLPIIIYPVIIIWEETEAFNSIQTGIKDLAWSVWSKQLTTIQSVATKEMLTVAMTTKGHVIKTKAFICWCRLFILSSVTLHLPHWDSVSVSCPTFSLERFQTTLTTIHSTVLLILL